MGLNFYRPPGASLDDNTDDKRTDEMWQAWQAAISVMMTEVEKLKEAAHWAVDYVGSANYSERIREAHRHINEALKTTSEKDSK